MKLIKDAITFCSAIVSTVIFTMMTDIFVGTVLGVTATALTSVFMNYWADQFKANKNGLTRANE
ncbi:hypothetical protein [Staphylococcus arlettae]|uniref:hypothetical protein n=1 Tax=Staphylococcus arlettae TaxID=29378 RepID=UPI0021CF29B9|nr:hypothetical protein [Staphylococcus arlettae]UXU53177.1 hypothetical protein MUA71_03625 [Staphylococcus arlettae]